MKKSIFFFAALCCAFITLLPQKAAGNTVCQDGVYYSKEKGMTGYVDYQYEAWSSSKADANYSALSGDVYIASYVQGVGIITKIGGYAFANKKDGGMFNVILPSTIQEIRGTAFLRATKLYSIQMNDGLTTIGKNVFYGCTDLTSVYIPTSLKEIPEGTFAFCTSLPAIALSAGIEHIGDKAFYECTALLSVKSQSGANNVKTIGDYAFSDCTSLSEMRFSNGMTSIGEYAFKNCTKLENLTLPAKLATIGDFAFAYSGLKTLTVNMTTPININANVFDGVDLSKCTLYVPAGCKEAYKNAAVWKKFGTILEIGEVPEEPITTGEQKIGNLWYDLHEDLTATIIYHSDYKNLTGALSIPASVTYGTYTYTVNIMQSQVFYECSQLTEVTLPNTITEIPARAFQSCAALTKVTLPSALTAIGQSAFYGCSALQNITLPASLTEIGTFAFLGCASLTSVSIPAGVKILNERCFHGCSNLATVRLSEGLTEIGTKAFFRCTALTSLTLPASLTTLGSSVFYDNSNMVSLRSLSETPPTALSNNTFYAMPVSTCILYVPAGTKEAYAAAEGWVEFTNIQEKGVNEKIKYGPLYYQLNENGTAYVTYETKDANNYKDLSGEVTVESKVIYHGFEYKVNEVGIDAFNGCTGITKVNLPLIMDEISYRAFKGCTNLAEVNIPSTLSFLINTAFEDTKLFNDNKDADGAVYYEGCLLYYPLNAITGTYSVKEGTRLIATDVFEFDEKITELILPEGLQCICNGSVTTMYALKTLHLPSSLYYIGGDFCNDCFYLTTIYNYSDSPVDLSDNYCFDNVNQSKCTLYVPKGSRTAYESASVWQDFPIFEMKGVYTVTFQDWNGQELKTEKVEEGNSASAPATPEREGYTFTGWDKDLTDIQSDLTVTAQYTVNTYTVRFIDPIDNSVISQQNVEYGMSAVEPDASQRKEHEGYFFVDWEDDFDIILSDKDVYAYYATVKYTVAFDKGNSTVDVYKVAHGETVDEVPAAEPFDCKTFVGWRSSLTGNLMTETEILSETVTEEVTYTADYEQDYYAITLVCSHGTVTCDEAVDLTHVACGTTLHFSFVPEEGYELAGWDNYDPATGYLVGHDDIIEALTQQKAAVYFTVTYFDWNMTVLGTEKVEEGKDAKGLESDPEREGYTFTGWSSPLTNITSDLNVQAQYEKKEPTALDDTDQENPATRPAKQFRNGILYINRNGILYDAAGNQVQ